ncbi:MAG: YcaO-like family protein [Nitrososphaeraceae archaeon]
MIRNILRFIVVNAVAFPLQSRKKWTRNGTSRIKPVDETLKKVVPICQKIGLTRVADITHMDILRVPNYSAVLPGTEDYIWVYSGKGPTKAHAKASALMESVERYSSLPSGGQRNFIQESYYELSKRFRVLHPDEVVEPLSFQYRDDLFMDFLPGFNLFTEEQIMIPAALTLFRYSPKAPAINPFAFHHTNGLASGNVQEEAICHSLCEVIERDATSLAELRASAIPFHFIKYISECLRAKGYSVSRINNNRFKDDPSIFPDVDVSEIEFEPAKTILKRFAKAGIPLIIKDITSDIGIPTFNASSVEWITHDYGYLAEGHGTHPDTRIALLRAITEVSQTRVANIHGARDDLRKINYGENNTEDKRAWQFISSTNTIKFSDIRTYVNEDILDDIRLILDRLKNVGLTTAIIIDLTAAKIGIPVVRSIVPGLETFKITKSIIGSRGRKYFKYE